MNIPRNYKQEVRDLRRLLKRTAKLLEEADEALPWHPKHERLGDKIAKWRKEYEKVIT